MWRCTKNSQSNTRSALTKREGLTALPGKDISYLLSSPAPDLTTGQQRSWNSKVSCVPRRPFFNSKYLLLPRLRSQIKDFLWHKCCFASLMNVPHISTILKEKYTSKTEHFKCPLLFTTSFSPLLGRRRPARLLFRLRHRFRPWKWHHPSRLWHRRLDRPAVPGGQGLCGQEGPRHGQPFLGGRRLRQGGDGLLRAGKEIEIV